MAEIAACKDTQPNNLDPNRYISLIRKTQNRKLLVLDLDETLVHCARPGENIENTYRISFLYKGKSTMIYVGLRPYAVNLLRWANAHFEVVVFTASH